MSDILYRAAKMKYHLSLIEAESRDRAIKEYEANWLAEQNTVLRDFYGRFAKKPTDGKPKPVATKSTEDDAIADDVINGVKNAVDNITDIFGPDSPLARSITSHLQLNPREDIRNWSKSINNNTTVKKAKKLAKETSQKYTKLIRDLSNLNSDSDVVNILGIMGATGIALGTACAIGAAPGLAASFIAPGVLETFWGGLLFGEIASTALAVGGHKARKFLHSVDNDIGAAIAGGVEFMGIAGGLMGVWTGLTHFLRHDAANLAKEVVFAGRKIKLKQYLKSVEEQCQTDKLLQKGFAKVRGKNLWWQWAEDVPPDIKKAIASRNGKAEKDLLAKFPKSMHKDVRELMARANTVLYNHFYDAKVFVRAPTKILDKIADDGLKNSFQLKKQSKYSSRRLAVEQQLFGVDKSLTSTKRPTYGYFGYTPNEEWNRKVQVFGDSVLHLRDEVKKFSTITPGDSFDVARHGRTSSLATSPHISMLVKPQKYIYKGKGEYDVAETSADEILDALKDVVSSKSLADLPKIVNKLHPQDNLRFFESNFMQKIDLSHIDKIELSQSPPIQYLRTVIDHGLNWDAKTKHLPPHVQREILRVHFKFHNQPPKEMLDKGDLDLFDDMFDTLYDAMRIAQKNLIEVI